MLTIVDSTQRRYRTSSRDKKELLSTLSLGIRSGNLKYIQFQFNLTDVTVHPGHHKVAHGLWGGWVHPVSSILLISKVNKLQLSNGINFRFWKSSNIFDLMPWCDCCRRTENDSKHQILKHKVPWVCLLYQHSPENIKRYFLLHNYK